MQRGLWLRDSVWPEPNVLAGINALPLSAVEPTTVGLLGSLDLWLRGPGLRPELQYRIVSIDNGASERGRHF